MARAFALPSGISTKNPGRLFCQSDLPVPVGKNAGEFRLCEWQVALDISTSKNAGEVAGEFRLQVALDISIGKNAGEVRVGRC